MKLRQKENKYKKQHPKSWKGCKYIKRQGESCTLNNNCKYPNCDINDEDA